MKNYYYVVVIIIVFVIVTGLFIWFSQSQKQPTTTSNTPVASQPTQITTDTTNLNEATFLKMYVTFYGWSDNDPPGNAIAFPKKKSGKSYHEVAGGIGTYDDPITMATDPDEFPVGTLVYIPYLQKYIIMEDTCASCINDWKTNKKYHIDIWMGGDGKNEEKLKECEGKWTREETTVELNPPNSRPVRKEPLFDAEKGSCI